MIFSEAQKEFQIRHYRWAISEFDKEIAASFPNLQLFKAGHAYEVYQLMQQFDETKRPALARALLKHRHYKAAEILGETLSAEEKILLGKDSVFSSNLNAKFEQEMAARKLAGEKIKFASKRKLQKEITAKFKEAFGGQIIGERSDTESEPWSVFEMKLCGWIISTQFWFGHHESLLRHHHYIDSESKTPLPTQPEVMIPAMRLEQRVTWLCFYELNHLSNEDVDPACDTVIKFCRNFFDGVPKLLKGLESEKVTPS